MFKHARNNKHYNFQWKEQRQGEENKRREIEKTTNYNATVTTNKTFDGQTTKESTQAQETQKRDNGLLLHKQPRTTTHNVNKKKGKMNYRSKRQRNTRWTRATRPPRWTSHTETQAQLITRTYDTKPNETKDTDTQARQRTGNEPQITEQHPFEFFKDMIRTKQQQQQRR